MEPQEQKHKLLKPVLIVLAGIVLVGGTGFGVWYWQNGEIQKQKTDSDKRISELQKQINDTKNQTVTTTKPVETKLTNDQIFQEVSSQFGIKKEQVIYFRILGQDKVQYSLGQGITYAYKQNNIWIKPVQDAEGLADCSKLNDIPEAYRPPCNDNGFFRYLDAQNQSTNYPTSKMTSYIGQ